MNNKENNTQKLNEVRHLTSKNNKDVADKISKISKMIFERNRKAYRVLANK